MAIRGPVLLTGATGFLGGHLLTALRAQGLEVTCLVRPSSDTARLAEEGAQLLTTAMDQGSEVLVDAASRHPTVIHVAGAIRALDYAGFLSANAEVTEVLAHACVQAHPRPGRFVLVSSVGATGPAPRGESLTEAHPPGERTDYGRSKWEGEQRLLGLRDQLPCTIVRPTAIYGPGDREMLPVFRLAKAGWLPAFAGPDQIYNLAHVDDIVRGILLAAQAEVATGSTYILGSEEEPTARELAVLLGQRLDRRTRLLPLPRALLWAAAACSEAWAWLSRSPAMLNRQKIPELTGSWSLDLTAARQDLGYRSRWTLARGIDQTMAWYRDHGLL